MNKLEMHIDLNTFLKDYRKNDGYIHNITDCDLINEIPELSGVYIIVSDAEKFIYPNGLSRVIYW
ncbi:MAG: hypothetical protein JEZ03_05565 [Bacteroidales bacterium]|nr:hypothetical protein [Bacteroidales bacterium]